MVVKADVCAVDPCEHIVCRVACHQEIMIVVPVAHSTYILNTDMHTYDEKRQFDADHSKAETAGNVVVYICSAAGI